MEITTLALLLALSLVEWAGSAQVIQAPWGQIRGVDDTSPSGLPYSVYRAIPYALPPLGGLRFSKPQAHPGPGAGRVFNATKRGPTCPQNGVLAFLEMSEDCLTLNVYLPAAGSGSGVKSVMVWIHGGGFTQGSAFEYTPSDLVTSSDVIVVVIQYRLDVLGFLSSGDDVVTGNYGLWDQALAIKWVKDNIRAFGGDPDSMTVSGESAGAASVGYQMLSPAMKGLRFKALLQSGSPLAIWALNRDPRKAFYAVANITGCLGSGGLMDRVYYAMSGGDRARHQQVLTCLRSKTASELIEAANKMPGPATSEDDVILQGLSAFVPTIDRDFVPRSPADLVRDVDYLADVGAISRDVMFGVNNEEGALIADAVFGESGPDANALAAFGRQAGALERSLLEDSLEAMYGKEVVKDGPRRDLLLNTLQFFYTSHEKGGQLTLQDVVDTSTDAFMVVPSVQFLQALAQASNKRPTTEHVRRYLYLFNHYPASKADQPLKGMNHADDLLYEFDGNLFFSAKNFNSDDLTIASTFKSFISNFAKTGTSQLTLRTGAAWPEYTMSSQDYLSLEAVPRVDSYLYGKRMALWLDLLPSLVNSTEAMGRWTLPWQQQTPYNYLTNGAPLPPGAKRFVFKGTMRFIKPQYPN